MVVNGCAFGFKYSFYIHLLITGITEMKNQIDARRQAHPTASDRISNYYKNFKRWRQEITLSNQNCRLPVQTEWTAFTYTRYGAINLQSNSHNSSPEALRSKFKTVEILSINVHWNHY